MATLVGVYGGYFGAGSGVMMLAVLGFGTDLDLRVLNATKTLAVLAGNGVAAVIYVVVADLDWRVVALLAAGSLVGGYVGAHVGRRLPTGLLRSLIVVAGVDRRDQPAHLRRGCPGVRRRPRPSRASRGGAGARARRWPAARAGRPTRPPCR